MITPFERWMDALRPWVAYIISSDVWGLTSKMYAARTCWPLYARGTYLPPGVSIVLTPYPASVLVGRTSDKGVSAIHTPSRQCARGTYTNQPAQPHFHPNLIFVGSKIFVPRPAEKTVTVNNSRITSARLSALNSPQRSRKFPASNNISKTGEDSLAA